MNCELGLLLTVSSVFVFGAFSLHAEQSGQTPVSGEVAMENPYKAIDARLDISRGPISVDDLSQIGKEIEGLQVGERSKSGQWSVQRRSKLELWLKAINAVDQMLDPAFNPSDVPQMNIALPGVPMDSGVDPSAIKDPTLRARYEKALKENAAKAERYRVQTRLRKIDTQWSAALNAYIKSEYKPQDADIDEIKRCADRCLSSPVRRGQIENTFGATP